MSENDEAQILKIIGCCKICSIPIRKEDLVIVDPKSEEPARKYGKVLQLPFQESYAFACVHHKGVVENFEKLFAKPGGN